MKELITEPGVYEVAAADYHGKEICAGPSISSSGLRAVAKCPAKYWWNSPLNPDRPPESNESHFAIGKAAHDLILDGVGWPDRYHVTPPGFSRAATVKQKDAIAAADAAELDGKTILSHKDNATVLGMADAIKRHPIYAAIGTGRGKAEQTIVWKDAETGVWLRCRPDFLPHGQKLIPDFKTTASAHPDDFAGSVVKFGYHQQAALYLDGIAAVFGPLESGRQFYFIAQEKEPPYVVQPFALDLESVEWGRRLNRKAIRTFAQCLETGKWPGYADDFVQVGLPRWQTERLEKTFTEF